MANEKLPPFLRGYSLLHAPFFNQDTSFSQEERDRLGLNGLLPFHISSFEEQIKRCYINFSRKKTSLGKYVYLMSLMNHNEQLFYQFISRYAVKMLPFLYTPTVGEASLQFSSVHWQQRGLYVSYPLKEKMEEMIANIPNEEVLVIVVTDGERILGLGDQGVGGMTIPIGKLILYTLFGGIHPSKTLPIVLDVGTNNAQLLENELYLGWKHRRVEGPDYDAFIEQFVKAIHKRYPNVLLQWEDFSKKNARPLLERYRKKLLSFNDDIQGTACVALSAIFSALKITGEALIHQRIVIVGAGSAGMGIAEMLVQALLAQGAIREEAYRTIYVVSRRGALMDSFSDLESVQRPFAKKKSDLKPFDLHKEEQISLLKLVTQFRPTILIGVCAQPGAFSKEIIQEMARHVERPIVLPLSNPTSKAECTPAELIAWTSAKAIIATGTPFSPVEYLGRTYAIAQCNNVYIFPGLGLGALAAQAREVSDGMLFQAAETLATYSPALHDPTAALFPPIEKVSSISRAIAVAVAKKAIQEKLSSLAPSEIEGRVNALRWKP